MNKKIKNTNSIFKLNFIKKGCRHWDFPSGPPPQYQPSLKALNFGVRMGSGVFTLVWPTTKLISILYNQSYKNTIFKNQAIQQKGCRHWDFPSGPPPQYQPSLKALNFGVRMGSGVFTLVWPTTKLISINNYLYLSCRHWDFPSGPPPQYQPSLKALNFGVRMGSGVFTLVWPTTKLMYKF
ncbi:MFS transporter (macronuclear) [Tetrahymena thermophila SB210]|uniref:MFS transporter n=1 Tax=Tetrahymena thermophila (strain SB210) TaxID=312017 RepID=I7MEV4_TETTS|nr:MFS transporter [Tetrahymena thermophila SB210]EAR97869.3 MFS transporter [Tetrahymena thermophila SB210]|eukprot:XP_001018114.3 MFS transporter [Tetrahymena thermophila SB210]